MSDIDADKEIELRKKKNTVKFLADVENEPLLWNTGHELYRSLRIKDKVWAKVASENGFPDIQAAKEEWKKLRDIFRDSLKRRKVKNLKPWKYAKEMSFVSPMLTVRKKKNTKKISAKRRTEQSDGEHSAEDRQTFAEAFHSSFGNYKEEPIEDVTSDIESEENDTNNQSKDATDVRSDALKKFFSSMLDSVTLLPRVYQLRVKRKIFEAVMAAEEEFLKSEMTQSEFYDVTRQVDNLEYE